MMPMAWARHMGTALLAWCLGVAVQLQQTALWPVAAYLLLLCLALWGGWTLRRRPWGQRVRVLAWGLLWAWLAFAVTGLHAQSRSGAIAAELEGQDLQVVGRVQAMPQRQDLGWRFRFRIEQAWRVGPSGELQPLEVPRDVPARVYLGWYGQAGVHDSGWNPSALPEPVQAGERWRLRVRLKAPHGHMNPRGFDYALWLWEQGLGATGHVQSRAKDPPRCGWRAPGGTRSKAGDRRCAIAC